VGTTKNAKDTKGLARKQKSIDAGAKGGEPGNETQTRILGTAQLIRLGKPEIELRSSGVM
jgi:hypothetical protein